MRAFPIRLRVAAAFAVAMAIVLAATGWFVRARLASDFSASLDQGLRLRVDQLEPLVASSRVSLAASSNSPYVKRGESYAQLVAADGTVVDATAPLSRTPLLDRDQLRAALREPQLFDHGPLPFIDESSRILATPVARGAKRLVLVVGVSGEGKAEALESLRNELLIAIPVAIFLASITGYALAGVALRPVESMRSRAATISSESADERLPVPATGDEIESLGATLNEMLDRLQLAMQRQREFVADAGHELRTPLSLLQSELELGLRHQLGEEELQDTVRRSRIEVDRLVQLAEGLLLLAGREGAVLPLQLEVVSVSEFLEGVAARFEWRARDAGRRIVVAPAPSVHVRVDRLRLEQALGNLVENALRHGAGDIELTAVGSGGNVELHVIDDGPGFPPTFVGRAFERFARADAARRPGGTGLGLAIVQEIAQAHGGTAHVANRTGRGADAWVTLGREQGATSSVASQNDRPRG
jgi:two-component system OmpR family sensor kinase